MSTVPARDWWAGRTVFVTGCSGFLGSWLSRALCDHGARVIGLDMGTPDERALFSILGLRDRVEWLSGQAEDYPLLERIISERPVETVFHLAAQSQVALASKFPRAAFEANVRGTWNLLDAVRISKRPISTIVASSESVYGASAASPNTEETPLDGRLPYDVSKICAELLARSYHFTYGIPTAIARFTNLYGGGDRNFQRIVPGTIRSVLLGNSPVIRGDGHSVRDFLYVDDAVSAYLALAEKMDRADVAGEAFNFSSERPCSVLDLVETILRLSGRRDLRARVLNEESSGVRLTALSSCKARERLGWTARISLENGLDETIRWYAERAGTMVHEGGALQDGSP